MYDFSGGAAVYNCCCRHDADNGTANAGCPRVNSAAYMASASTMTCSTRCAYQLPPPPPPPPLVMFSTTSAYRRNQCRRCCCCGVSSNARSCAMTAAMTARTAFSSSSSTNVHCVVGGALVRFARFVPTLLHVRRTEARNGLHFAEDVVEHITPVAKHVHDDPAIIFLAVIP